MVVIYRSILSEFGWGRKLVITNVMDNMHVVCICYGNIFFLR